MVRTDQQTKKREGWRWNETEKQDLWKTDRQTKSDRGTNAFLPQAWNAFSHANYSSNDIAMGDHDPFWDARGATGVHDHRDVSGERMRPLHSHYNGVREIVLVYYYKTY